MRPIFLAIAIAVIATVPGHAQTYGECLRQHPDRADLIGRWRWIETIDWVHNDSWGPGDTGEEEVWTFRSDGHFTQRTGSSGELDVIRAGAWCIRSCDAICAGADPRDPGPPADVIGLDSTNHIIYGFDSATGRLEFYECGLDGYTYQYEFLGTVGSHGGSWTVLKSMY